jgi:hypothetical protein
VIRGQLKRVGSVAVLLEASARTFSAGPTTARLYAYTPPSYERANVGIAFTGKAEMALDTTYGNEGRVCIRHTDPLPLTILGILPNVEPGG